MSAGVYLVKGSDDVLREEAVLQLVDRLVGDGDRSLLVDEFSGADFELAAAVDAAQTLPFLTDRRIVVIRHAARFSNAESQAPLLTYLAEPADTTALVVVWEKSPEAGARLAALPPKLKKALEAAGAETVDHEPPARQREDWVGEHFSARGIKLDAAARRMVTEQLGENPGAVVEVIERAVGIHGPGAHLHADDIGPLLGEAGGVPPWELTDAIDKGDTALALERLSRMIHGGSRHPLQIMATLHGHYTRMLRLDGAGVSSEKDAAQVLGLRGSTFPARKAMTQASKLGTGGIRQAIGFLAEADVDLRGAQAWPDHLVVEVLVARLTRLSRVRR
jgi:DNA polymerase III subunit delta